MAERRQGSVTYREAGAEYFDQRKLRRHAGVWSLWALGVGAVISGDFFGWNFGLAYGFGGLLVATLVITVMFFGLCFSIAEMSPALPHTGGAYSFSRSAMGPWGGFANGVAETIEYVITPAVIVVGIGAYLNSITDDLFGFTLSQPLWWAVFYAFPFAIWFYLAIEELPLAAEESADPKRDIPRGTMYGLYTLIVTGFLVLFLNAGIEPGSAELSESGEPLLEG